MAGGIQKGTEAGSIESKKLDNNLKTIAGAVAKYQKEYIFEEGYRAGKGVAELAELNINAGCVPDGGMWFKKIENESRELFAVFEAKHQGNHGNANERWHKNFALCKKIGSNLKYITLMTGEGAKEGGVLEKHAIDAEILYGNNVKFYCRPNGFSEEEIFDIIKENLSLNILFEDIQSPINSSKLFE